MRCRCAHAEKLQAADRHVASVRNPDGERSDEAMPRSRLAVRDGGVQSMMTRRQANAGLVSAAILGQRFGRWGGGGKDPRTAAAPGSRGQAADRCIEAAALHPRIR